MSESVRFGDRPQAGSYGQWSAPRQALYPSGPCLELASVLLQGRLVVAECYDLFGTHP